MKRRHHIIAISALLVSVGFALPACSEVKSEESDAEKVVSIPVNAQPVIMGEINAAYGSTASLEATAEAAVAARVSGIVTNLYVEEGDFVKAGQALAQLDIEKLELEMRKATARYKQAANDLQRNKKIFAKKLVSVESFDRVKFEYESQKAAKELAQLNLEYATIRAPIDGIISVRYIKQGNLLQMNASAFHISDFSELQAIVHIPESEKAGLAVGQSAAVYVEASNHPFLGQVERISPVVDKDSGTIRVTVSVKDDTKVLRPGMFGRVNIVYETHQQAVLVPKDSVISEDAEESVFIVEEGTAYKRIVQTGFRNATHIEILDGVKAHEMVIVTGQRNIRDEAKVEIIDAVAVL